MQTAPPPGAMCAVHPELLATGTCARCGNFTCAQCAPPGGEGLCTACMARGGVAEREPPPWERRDELGLFTALGMQLKTSILKPDQFFRSLPPEGSLKEALLFGWLVSAAQALPMFLMQRLNYAQMEQSLSMLFRGHPPAWFTGLSPWAYAAVLSLPVLVIYPLTFLISAGLTHLGCVLWGAGGRGFTATARVVGYAQGPMLLAWVPVVGGLLSLYVIALEVFGISRVHETSVGRAIGGVLTVPLVLGCCIGSMAVYAAVQMVSHLQ